MVRRRDARGDVAPQRIEVAGYVLRRMTVEDAAAVSAAATESLEHLRPWMPWATPEGVSMEAQQLRMSSARWSWGPDGDYEYGIFLDDGRLVGVVGMHRRVGPGALEVGYWVHVAHLRRGIATTAARAATDVGFALRGVRRMEIHCDAANVASAAVPARLGYVLARTEERAPEAPGEEGRRLIWVVHERQWRTTTR